MKWKGFQPPTSGKGRGRGSPIGRMKSGGPIGGYKIGRKTKSRKMKEVFG